MDDRILTGGNHLANVLIGKLGSDFAKKYPPDLDAESALRRLGATVEYDVWCCWAAIMRESMTISEPTGKPTPLQRALVHAALYANLEASDFPTREEMRLILDEFERLKSVHSGRNDS